MPRYIPLLNMTDVLERAKAPKMPQEEIITILQGAPIEEFYSIGKGKGGRVMIRPEDEAAVQSFIGSGPPRKTRRKRGESELEVAHAKGPALAPDLGAIREEMELLRRRMSDLEDMQLEETGRVDQLHKAVESVNAVYAKLRAEVDPRAEMPEPPALPPKYRFKVLIGGGHQGLMEKLRANFREIRFIHLTTENTINQQKTTMPRVDQVIVLSDSISHRLHDSIQREYKKENILLARASLASLEPLLSLWLSQKKKEMEAPE